VKECVYRVELLNWSLDLRGRYRGKCEYLGVSTKYVLLKRFVHLGYLHSANMASRCFLVGFRVKFLGGIL